MPNLVSKSYPQKDLMHGMASPATGFKERGLLGLCQENEEYADMLSRRDGKDDSGIWHISCLSECQEPNGKGGCLGKIEASLRHARCELGTEKSRRRR